MQAATHGGDVSARIAELVAAARRALPNQPVPCFAYLRVRIRDREREYLLGPQTALGHDVSVLQWREAPLAAAFFAGSEDDPTEIEIDGRTVELCVLERRLIELDGGRVRRLAPFDGAWLTLRPRAERARGLSAIEVALDAVQRRAVDAPAGGTQLFLGEAGVGKTTVALHRAASLVRRGARRSLVIVPTEGLRRLTASLLERLAVPAGAIEVARYDQWARALALRSFPGLPRRESEDAGLGVLRVKRHRALGSVLDVAAQRAPDARVGRGDLLHLFGNRVAMEKVEVAAGGDVRSGDVRDVLEHTRIQFSETTEEEYAHVIDRSRLATLDGRAIDAGTPMGDAATIDVEDYAVLFEIARRRALARGRRQPALPARYDIVVVDEAQEFAPLELALIGRSLARGGTLIVAGDAGQQIDPTTCFSGWSAAMTDLRAARYAETRLDTSYRCPPEVTELARHVLDPARAPGPAGSSGAAVNTLCAGNECHLAAWIGEGLRRIDRDDPRASVAVIARTPEAARRWAQGLRHCADVRLALDGDFRFDGGMQVTCVAEVKGLEFDYVVVPDASPAVYPSEPEARRALYVALTRAVHSVTLAAVGRLSPILGGIAAV